MNAEIQGSRVKASYQVLESICCCLLITQGLSHMVFLERGPGE